MIVATFLKLFVLTLTLFHSLWLAKRFFHSTYTVTFIKKIKLIITGILSFLADTIGIGSFAINIALVKTFKLMPTSKLPGYVNAAQVLPSTIQALIFMKLIDVDLLTLTTLSVSTAIGGMLGAKIISKLNTNFLKKIMIISFICMIGTILATETHLIQSNGSAIALSGYKLVLTAFCMMIAGSLCAACVGLYATSQAILFVAGISPFAAFPIMMAAGALQQPLVALTYLANNKVPIKEAIIVTLSGLIGVAIGLPLITHVSTNFLHYLLICVLLYNILSLVKTIQPTKETTEIKSQLQAN